MHVAQDNHTYGCHLDQGGSATIPARITPSSVRAGARTLGRATAAAAVLAAASDEGQTYKLVGDEAWTFSYPAAERSRQTDRTILYTNLPPQEVAKILTGAGLPVWVEEFVVGGHVAAGQGLLFDDRASSRR